jgi:hypothetical protein
MRALALLVALTCVVFASGCANPDTPKRPGAAVLLGSPGEPAAPAPPSPAAQEPSGAQPTPQKALIQFASRFINWDYRTLAEDQLSLARISIGAARLTEQQAAAQTTRDSTLTRARVWNRGTVAAIAPDRTVLGVWWVVTREQTGGSDEYAGLPASYHLTRAQVAEVPDGWAVSRWEPQN